MRERESPWKLQKTSCGKRKFSFGGVAAKGVFRTFIYKSITLCLGIEVTMLLIRSPYS